MDGYIRENLGAAAVYFGLTYDQSRALFVPNYVWGAPGNNATPKQVAKWIRKFVKERTE